MSAPGRPQHLVALDWANRVRLARSEVRRQVAAGKLTVAAALDHWACQTATIGDVLTWQHRWGRARARRALVAAGVPEARRVEQLTPRQRDAVLARVAAGGSS